MGLAGKGKAATLPLTKPARTFACVFAWFFVSFNELAFYGFGSALAAGARVFSPTHPPFCFWDRERSGAGGMQHSGSGAALGRARDAGRGLPAPTPSPAFAINNTNSSSPGPRGQAKGPGPFFSHGQLEILPQLAFTEAIFLPSSVSLPLSQPPSA